MISGSLVKVKNKLTKNMHVIIKLLQLTGFTFFVKDMATNIT